MLRLQIETGFRRVYKMVKVENFDKAVEILNRKGMAYRVCGHTKRVKA